jgi:hypothetical protein
MHTKVSFSASSILGFAYVPQESKLELANTFWQTCPPRGLLSCGNQ